MAESIPGGGFVVARKIFLSKIWLKHPLYLKAWIWILGRASHSDHEKAGHVYIRGEFVTSHKDIIKACEYRLNRRRIIPTLKQIRTILEWFQAEGMITIEPISQGHTTGADTGAYPQELTRAYIGIKIIVENYNTYQDLKSYKGIPQEGNRGRHRGIPQGHDNNNGFKKNGIKRTPDEILKEISLLLDKLFPSPEGKELFSGIIKAISSTRKTGKVSPSVILSLLLKFDGYPEGQVLAGMKTYLEKGYHAQGKREPYLIGIIRNLKADPSPIPEPKSTGSSLLDAYYLDRDHPEKSTFGANS